MKNFFLVANREKENTEEVAGQICRYLEGRGASCCICPQMPEEGDSYRYTDARMVPEGTEAVLVLGGDGTLIQAARDLAKRNLPLLGINMGTLGYLTEGSTEEVPQILDALLEDRFWTETRMFLRGRAYRAQEQKRHEKPEFCYEEIALNDIVISRCGVLRMLRFQIFVNGELLSSYKADGMIVATPTGSTAYNLSAGGPIVDPQADMIILTPICAHTLNARSIVLPASDMIQIRIQGQAEDEQAASFDGDAEILLHSGDFIEVERAEMTARMIKLTKTSFVERLREKMASPVA